MDERRTSELVLHLVRAAQAREPLDTERLWDALERVDARAYALRGRTLTGAVRPQVGAPHAAGRLLGLMAGRAEMGSCDGRGAHAPHLVACRPADLVGVFSFPERQLIAGALLRLRM